MVEAGSSPTCTVTSRNSPRSRTSAATSARIFAASGGPSIHVAKALDRQLNFRHVQPERLGEAHADLEVLLQPLDVARMHCPADEGAFLGAPEGVLDEGRQQLVRRI